MRRFARLCIFTLSFMPLAAFAGQTPSAAPKGRRGTQTEDNHTYDRSSFAQSCNPYGQGP
jgi:hypothetical protein